jgi:5-phospho-D-xylono-1,4-lactonase
MTTVETTLGPLPVDQLGRINAHDHVIMEGGYTVVKTPDFNLNSVEKAVEEITLWRDAGGGAIVDCQPFGCGRNVEKLIRVSQATGVPIIVPTGFQASGFYLPDHWQHRYSEDEVYELLYEECHTGADLNNYDGPIVRRGPVRAGFIKVAGDYQVVPPTMRKLIRAAGRVHQALGVPVLVHTDTGTCGDELLDLLEAAGVPPGCVMLCHVDRNADFPAHQRWAQRGAYLEYDSPSRIKYQPETVVIQLMRQMFDAGHGDRLLLGGDMARRSYWKAYGGGPGYDYLLKVFTPRLLAEGFSQAELDRIWRDNPARWLTSGR